DDGTMARLPDLGVFAEKHGLKIGAIADLIAYRLRTEMLVKKIYKSDFSSRYGGDFKFCLYSSTVQYAEHAVLVKGDIKAAKGPVLVRMHAVDMFGDILGGGENSTLHRAMEIIGAEGCGAVVILRQSDPHALSRRLLKDAGGAAQ